MKIYQRYRRYRFWSLTSMVGLLLLLRQVSAPLTGLLAAPLPPPPPPEQEYRSYTAGGKVVIDRWQTAASFFYDYGRAAPQPYSEPLYVDPAFEDWVRRMRPAILESARRHNHPEITQMDDRQFASVMVAILYLENNSALNDRTELGREVTPLYEGLQVTVNQSGVGTDFSIRPTNLRPSVAIDILNGRVPLPKNPTDQPAIYRPIKIHGSELQEELRKHPVVDGWTPSAAQITDELTDDRLAIEYLAANLEIAQYRCQYEWVPATWISLATWHNQGIVAPLSIVNNPAASIYISRMERYLPIAAKLIYNPPRPPLNTTSGEMTAL